MALEIPSSLIHQLQLSLRSDSSFSDTTTTSSSFPSVTDSIAAPVDASSSPSTTLRCERCGNGSGFIRAADSSVCVFCGSFRKDMGTAFGATDAYGWLLGSLGLDGSELVNFDSEPTDSSKSKDSEKSGMVLSDLLNLKITWSSKNEEASKNIINKEPAAATYVLNLSGVDLHSFFSEKKKERPPLAAAAISSKDTFTQKKQSTSTRIFQFSGSEVYVSSDGFHSSVLETSSGSTKIIESIQGIANWEADFQCAGLENPVPDSKQIDLFQSSSVLKSFSPPSSMKITNQSTDTENQSKTKGTSLGFLEPFDETVSSDSVAHDSVLNEKHADSSFESHFAKIGENNGDKLKESFVGDNHHKVDQSHVSTKVSDNTGNSTDEVFNDWQEFTTAGPEGVKSIDLPVSSVESSENVKDGDTDDPFDDWRSFATSSGEVQGGLTNPAGEAASISFEHSGEIKSANLWSVDITKESGNLQMANENNITFDDCQEFTSSENIFGGSFNPVGAVLSISFDHPTETNSANSLVGGEIKEPDSTADSLNGNDDSFDWPEFTSSNPGVEINPKETESVDSWIMRSTNNSEVPKLLNGNNDSFDEWLSFVSSGETQSNLSKLEKEINNISVDKSKEDKSEDFWLTGNNIKESNSNGLMNGKDDSSDGWQDSTSSGQIQETSSKVPGGISSTSPENSEGTNSVEFWLTSNTKGSNSAEVVNKDNGSFDWQDISVPSQVLGNLPKVGSIEHPLQPESLNLWAPSGAKELSNIATMNKNDDSSDDWQDFTTCASLEKSLPSLADASLFDFHSGSKADALQELDFGSFINSSSFTRPPGGEQSSNKAKNVQSDSQSDRINGTHQMTKIDSLTIKGTTDFDQKFTSEQEPTNKTVEKLLFQMHDLSFMLADDLSIPNMPVHSSPKS